MSEEINRIDVARKHHLKILYEDNHLLVVEKPVNIPVQADASGDPDFCSVCRAYLKEAGNKQGDAYIGIVHRLDRPVGGVMVFAKTSKAADRLTKQFKGHDARKHYVAIVDAESPCGGKLTDYLLKNEKTNTTSVVPEGTENAKLAKLSYRTIGRERGHSLLDVTLYTGRSHQIRVQLSHAGLPLLGDQRYHPDAIRASREKDREFKRTQICLWAYALTIQHPTLNEEMTFYSVPQGEEWNRYSAQMEMLPAFKVCSGIYADSDFIVCDKNAGVETEGELLTELLSIYGEVYPVHRLDANTEGIVLFARTAEKQAELETRFYEHSIKKTYLAVLAGIPEKDSGLLVNYAVKDAQKAQMTVCKEGTLNAMRMELAYRVLRKKGDCCLAEIDLHTGKTHQIRVQMAEIGCPVLGDDKYGDREKNRKYRIRMQQLLCKKMQWDEFAFESLKELELPETVK